LLHALEAALKENGLTRTRADVRAALAAGPEAVRALLQELAANATPPAVMEGATRKPPTLVLCIDQGEELFNADGAAEARQLFELIAGLASAPVPDVIAVFTIRTDAYEPLQSAEGPATPLADLKQVTLSLPPMAQGAYQSVIEGPAARLTQSGRKLDIAPDLTAALLRDIEEGGAKDALPLLAFTLERLYLEHGGDGKLTLAKYEALGAIKGAIEAAVQQAFKAADANSAISRDDDARRKLLRRGLIPWLAGIDPETGSPRRKVARLSQIPAESRPLIDLLVEVRLLATDRDAETGEATIEPAHEALLRQWGLLEGWLEEDFAALTVLEGVKRAARDWEANDRRSAWLAHSGTRLKEIAPIAARLAFTDYLSPSDRNYLDACRKAELTARRAKRRVQVAISILALLVVTALFGWLNRAIVEKQAWAVLATLKILAHQSFKDCPKCPEMVVIPAGKFIMGTAADDKARKYNEELPHLVRVPKPFAVSKFEITFGDWDACLADRGCNAYRPNDQGWGRGRRPVIYVNWDDAIAYLDWLIKKTGNHYRFLTEEEWEYAARAGTSTRWYSGNDESSLPDVAWYSLNSQSQTHPVGLKKPNSFGLFDMHGNVAEWVGGGCPHNLCSYRGGHWADSPEELRSAYPFGAIPYTRMSTIGLRVARDLN